MQLSFLTHFQSKNAINIKRLRYCLCFRTAVKRYATTSTVLIAREDFVAFRDIQEVHSVHGQIITKTKHLLFIDISFLVTPTEQVKFMFSPPLYLGGILSETRPSYSLS